MIGMMRVHLKTFAAGARRLLGLKTIRRLTRQQDGAAAVEFAMVAAPFLALVFAIMETAMGFFAGQVLETAAGDSAPLIMTGQAQNQSFDQAAFKDAVCSRIYGLFNCTGGIYIDVKTYTSFASVDTTPPIDQNGKLITNFSYQPGAPGDIVVVRLFYQWPVYVPLLGFNLADMAGGQRVIACNVGFCYAPL